MKYTREYYCGGCIHFATRKDACKFWNLYLYGPDSKPCHEWKPRKYKSQERPYEDKTKAIPRRKKNGNRDLHWEE